MPAATAQPLLHSPRPLFERHVPSIHVVTRLRFVRLAELAEIALEQELQEAFVEYEESKEEMAGGEQLTVTIVRGRDLEVADWSMLGEAFSDPYCMLAIAPNWPPEEPKYPFLRPDKKADAYKYTTVKKQTLNPDYNETFVFNQIESLGSHVLFLQVYDWDRCGDDDPLGHAYIDIEKLK